MSGELYSTLRKRIPAFIKAADLPIKACWTVEKDIALQRNPIIQINHRDSAHAIILDIDYKMSLRDINRLPGNLAVVNPSNGHLHLIIMLEKWVRKDGGKAHAFLNIITKRLTALLKADTGYSGFLAKNPFHDAWDVVTIREKLWTVQELRDLLDGLGSEGSKNMFSKRSSTGFIDPSSVLEGARNDTLFRMCRRQACIGHQDITGFAIRYNAALPTPLPQREAIGVSRSVEKWALKNRVLESFRARQKKLAHRKWDRIIPRINDEWRIRTASRERPWEAEGLSRAAWYRRRRQLRSQQPKPAIMPFASGRQQSIPAPVSFPSVAMRLPISSSSAYFMEGDTGTQREYHLNQKPDYPPPI